MNMFEILNNKKLVSSTEMLNNKQIENTNEVLKLNLPTGIYKKDTININNKFTLYLVYKKNEINKYWYYIDSVVYEYIDDYNKTYYVSKDSYFSKNLIGVEIKDYEVNFNKEYIKDKTIGKYHVSYKVVEIADFTKYFDMIK